MASPGRALAPVLLAILVMVCSAQELSAPAGIADVDVPLQVDYADFGSPLPMPNAERIYTLDPDQV